MSTAFELQTYQNGQWQFDSYFDDRDTVISEAERMNNSGKYAGVRVLAESYKPNTNTSQYQVIFSRLGKDASPGGDWRDQVQNAHPKRRPEEDFTRLRELRSRHRPPLPAAKEAKKASPVALLILATFLVLAGIAAIIALRSYAGIS